MITLTAVSKCYGNNGQYLARISGRSGKYTFERSFLGRKSDRTTSALVDEPGLYEEADIDKKGRKEPSFVLVLQRPAEFPPLSDTADKEWMKFTIAESDAMSIAKRIGEGEQLTDIVEIRRTDSGYKTALRSKSEAKKTAVSVTIETATEQCWQVLQALPERETKKVLAALKLRVTPKPQPEPEPEAQSVAETTVEE